MRRAEARHGGAGSEGPGGRGPRWLAGAVTAVAARLPRRRPPVGSVCHLLHHPLAGDGRTQRQARSAADAGWAVTILCRAPRGGAPPADLPDVVVRPLPLTEGLGVQRRLGRRPAAPGPARPAPTGSWGAGGGTEGSAAPPPAVPHRTATPSGPRRASTPAARAARALGAAARWADWRQVVTTVRLARAATAHPAAVVHAHNVQTLAAGAWAAQRTGAALVYDAHELERARTAATPRWRRRAARTERWLVPLVDRVVTVSPSIADELARRHGRATVVVRNLPWRTDAALEVVDAGVRRRADERIVVYTGWVQADRGLESLVDALALVPDHVVAVLLGPRDERFAATLVDRAVAAGVAGRLRFVEPVGAHQVVGAAAAADIGWCCFPDASENLRYSLPNKLFEYLNAGLCVLAGELPDMAEVVRATGAGTTCRAEDPEAVAATLARLVADDASEELAEMRRSARRAAEQLCWDVEQERLLALYHSLAEVPAAR